MFDFWFNWIFSLLATSIFYRILAKQLNVRRIKFNKFKNLKTDEEKRDIINSIILYTNILITMALVAFTFTYFSSI